MLSATGNGTKLLTPSPFIPKTEKKDMNIYRATSVILGLLFSANWLFGQDPKDDFKKINEAYLKQNEFSMDVVYNLYENSSTKAIFQSERAEVKHSKGKQYYKIATYESLFTDKYAIVLDHESKVAQVVKSIAAKKKNIFSVDLDTVFLKLCQSVEHFEDGPNQRGYKLKTDHSEYEEIHIYFNKQTYFIEKMVLFYAVKTNLRDPEDLKKQNKPRMEILCTNINFSPNFTKSTFSEQKYISTQGMKIQLQPAYKTYKLISQL